MQPAEILGLARRFLSVPTAPYHEQQVRALVQEHCETLGLKPERDRVGNLIVRYRHPAAPTQPPLVCVAHMDHPGFEALGNGRAQFLGHVAPEMFAPGVPVQFFTAHGRVRTLLRRRRQPADRAQPVIVELANAQGLVAGSIGMWDLPLVRVGGDRLRAVAIDDVLGVAALLAALTAVVKQRRRTHVWALFTRAEEVGFPGAIALARSGLIPAAALVISLEMSKQRPWARIGQGPVIRLGDKATLFDPLAALFLQEAARRAGVSAQRALMDGGTCEATAFGGFGYRVGGVCLPLGNYHNIGPKRRPAPEYVSLQDLVGLVALLQAAAADWPRFGQTARVLRQRLLRIERTVPRKLTDS